MASSECVRCHPKQVQGYLETGMGRSISRNFGQPPVAFTHDFSATKFSVSATRSGMRQRVERDGFFTERDMDYVIGSGNSAFGYLVVSGGHIFQSPLSYYTRKSIWSLAPGFENNRHPEFERPVTAECLWCHSGRPRPLVNSVNRFQTPIFENEAISCDRCHGPVERHLENPSASTIVNPARLPPSARDSVCEQCHLSGEARILNPGRTFDNFQPGMELQDVFSVYVYEASAGAGRFKVVSHVEQLAASRCAEASQPRIWCGTCHNPHVKPANALPYYRQRCLSCHAGSLDRKHASQTGCISCHMPQRRPFDGGHAAFTDHRIVRRPLEPGEPAAAEKIRAWDKLRAWREPSSELSARNLGLAYANIGIKNQSAQQADAGLRLLTQSMKSFPQDPEIPGRLGELLLLKGKSELALELFQYAAGLQPGFPPRHAAVADAASAAAKPLEAAAAFERAIELDPLYEPAYRGLAKLHADSGRPDLARQTWQRYLQKAPGSIFAQQALARLAPK